MSDASYDFSGLRAIFFNGTLTPSPGRSHTEGLIGVSSAIMGGHGVEVEVIRTIDEDIATGVYPDMTEPSGHPATPDRTSTSAYGRPTSWWCAGRSGSATTPARPSC